MVLATGSRLGPYEILSPLGSGGMGPVYRARDTRLGRDVAVKILPDAFVTDADGVARFQPEAQALATLNHPNIAIIHDLQRDGSVHGVDPLAGARGLRWIAESCAHHADRQLAGLAQEMMRHRTPS